MRNDSFSIRFYPNPSKWTDDGQYPIYARITVNRKKSELSVKCGVSNLLSWDDLTQRERNNRSTVNPILTRIESKLTDIYVELKVQGKQVTSQLIKQNYLHGGQQQIHLNQFVSSFFEKHVQGSSAFSPATIKNYSGTIKHFLAFLVRSKRNGTLLLNADELLVREFDQYLLNTSVSANGQLMRTSTRMKHHKRMKSVFSEAMMESLIDRNPYMRFKFSQVFGNRVFLTREELSRLESTSLGGNKSLENIRNIFLFSVYTGIRYNDAQGLTVDNLEHDGKKFWLLFQQQKTGNAQRIPLLIKAVSIIKKYEELAGTIGFLLPRISNQKINAYLKIIGQVCGIKKKITHHIARHTFASTVMLSNGASIEVVSRQLGHTDIRTTQIYAKITNEFLSETTDMVESKLG